jgi:hypothetical protein
MANIGSFPSTDRSRTLGPFIKAPASQRDELAPHPSDKEIVGGLQTQAIAVPDVRPYLIQRMRVLVSLDHGIIEPFLRPTTYLTDREIMT